MISHEDEIPVEEIGNCEHGGEGDATASIDPFGNFLRCHTRFFKFNWLIGTACMF